MEIFLKKHASKDKNSITHTKIGCEKLGIYGGSYSIQSEELDEFYKHYK